MHNTPKRAYRNTLDYVESGFRACWRNAQDLVWASKSLLDSGFHAPVLSLAVLALEELGKLYYIDGLLFARHNDHKAATFAKASTSHSLKLTVFELFPLLLGNLSRADPRYGKEQSFALALAISLQNLKEDGKSVMMSLENGDFLGLDRWKQKGFYVRAADKGFIAPRDGVDPDFVKSVYRLAWRATTTLDFLLKGGNLDRYIENARAVRAVLTEKQHQELERIGAAFFDELFCMSGDNSDSEHRYRKKTV